ncbi:hypothetical protein Q7404_08330 [Glaesserella parasuis]|nr:hypothetical protein [Glaesserella parasuis]
MTLKIYEVPVKNIPNQSLSVVVGGVGFDIELNTRLNEELYISLKANGKSILNNRICRDRTPLISVEYLNVGNVNLAFFDTKSKQNPHYQALGTRYKLIFVER